MTTILHLASSTRGDESVTRMLADELIDRLRSDDTTVIERPLVDGVSHLTVAATADLASAPADRSPDAIEVLSESDAIVDELNNADVLVIGVPIYNFGPPASLKAWADLVARAGVTFRYTETGPEGLLADRPVYIVAASGGVPIGSPMDFGTTWLRQFLGFLGLTNVTVISADGLAADPSTGIDNARTQITQAA